MTYPADWGEVALRMKDAAGWCCEACGSPHDPNIGYSLTVHHIDGDKSNVSPQNLIALCQRCHLRAQGKLGPLRRGQLILPGMESEVVPLWEVIDARGSDPHVSRELPSP